MFKLVKLTDSMKMYQVKELDAVTPISLECVIPPPGVSCNLE